MLTQERREQLALSVMLKGAMWAQKKGIFAEWYATVRERSSVSGQLVDSDGNKLFPYKKRGKEFKAFLARVNADCPIEGDGAIALAAILFHYYERMRWMKYSTETQYKEWYQPKITEQETVNIFQNDALKELGLSHEEMLDMPQFVDWLKSQTYPKVAHTG